MKVGDLVAVRPNSGWYGKWRTATVVSMKQSDPNSVHARCRIQYYEPTWKMDSDGNLTKSPSVGDKFSGDLIVLQLDPSLL